MLKKIKIESLINPAIYFFIILSLVFFFGKKSWWPDYYTPVFFGFAFLISALLIILPKYIFKTGDKHQTQALILLRAVLALALILNALGEIYLYQLYLYGIPYDKLIHFADSLLLLIIITSFFMSWSKLPLKKALTVSIILILIGSFLWEVIEFTSDWLFKTKEFGIYGQYKAMDTIFDILSDLAGILAGSLILLKTKLGVKIVDDYCRSPEIMADGKK